MKLKKSLSILLLICISMLLLTACGNKEKHEGGNDAHKMKELKVEVQTNPSKPAVNEKTTIQAIVTYGDKSVKDADEVKFELWEKNKDESEIIEGVHKKDGIYEITKTFDHPGTYSVMPHVTAKGMHTMPKVEIIVQ